MSDPLTKEGFLAATAAASFLKQNPLAGQKPTAELRIKVRRWVCKTMGDDYRPEQVDLVLDHIDALVH